MKKYIILVILAVLVIGAIVFFYYNKKEVLKSDKKQVEVLESVYKDFLKNKMSNDYEVTLDDSCLKNIITKNDFSDEDKEILWKIESNDENSSYFSYVLYSIFDSENLVLTLNLRRSDGNQENTQRYKLHVSGGKIKYEIYGLGTSFFAQPSN